MPSNCEECKDQRAAFALQGQKPRWCKACKEKGSSAEHKAAVNVVYKRCEDCHERQPTFAPPGQKKPRWCKACTKKGSTAEHKAAVNVVGKMCQDCRLQHPSFAPEGQKPRWCKACKEKGSTTEHKVAIDVRNKRCVDCRERHPSYAPEGQKARWCKACKEKGSTAEHQAAIDVRNKKCEGCRRKQPSFAPLGQRARWCKACKEKGSTAEHKVAVDVVSKNFRRQQHLSSAAKSATAGPETGTGAAKTPGTAAARAVEPMPPVEDVPQPPAVTAAAVELQADDVVVEPAAGSRPRSQKRPKRPAKGPIGGAKTTSSRRRTTHAPATEPDDTDTQRRSKRARR